MRGRHSRRTRRRSAAGAWRSTRTSSRTRPGVPAGRHPVGERDRLFDIVCDEQPSCPVRAGWTATPIRAAARWALTLSNGSASSNVPGSTASARARATGRFVPPDSSDGCVSARSSSPTSSSGSRTRSVRRSPGTDQFEGDVLPDGQPRERPILLEYHGPVGTGDHNGFPVDEDPAVGRCFEPTDEADEGRLPTDIQPRSRTRRGRRRDRRRSQSMDRTAPGV